MFKLKIYDYSELQKEIYSEYTKISKNIIAPPLEYVTWYFTSGEELENGVLTLIKIDSEMELNIDVATTHYAFDFYQNPFSDHVFQFGPYLTIIPKMDYAKLKLKNKIITFL